MDLQFAGEPYVRELDHWQQADGKLFAFPLSEPQRNLDLTMTFKLNGDVPQLLEKAKPKNFAEMDAKIAGWQKPESKKIESYSYHNFVCERPGRLWLVLPFLSPTNVAVTLNGQAVVTAWDSHSTSAFVDVTDLVNYGRENRLKLRFASLNQNGFMGPFLLYPEEAETEKLLPAPLSHEPQVVYEGSLVPKPLTRYREGGGPIITEAKMLGHVTLRDGAPLQVRVNLPPEKVKRVMYFESGFTWMGQHGLDYDSENQCWTAEVRPGDRGRIQENEDIYVWAEGTDGLRSEYYPVKVDWDFLP